jgi:hypothetical protein
MTDLEIRGIEAALGFSLPPHHRDFFLNYPKQLAAAERRHGTWRERTSERELYSAPALIVEANRLVREAGIPWLGDQGDPWPEDLLVVGDDGCGNYWGVKVSGTDRSVYFYDHELADLEEAYESLWAFADFLVRDVAERNDP